MESSKQFEVIADFEGTDGSIQYGLTIGSFDDWQSAKDFIDRERKDMGSGYYHFEIVDYNQG